MVGLESSLSPDGLWAEIWLGTHQRKNWKKWWMNSRNPPGVCRSPSGVQPEYVGECKVLIYSALIWDGSGCSSLVFSFYGPHPHRSMFDPLGCCARLATPQPSEAEKLFIAPSRSERALIWEMYTRWGHECGPDISAKNNVTPSSWCPRFWHHLLRNWPTRQKVCDLLQLVCFVSCILPQNGD